MSCPGNIGPVSVRIKTISGVATTVDCCPDPVEVPDVFVDARLIIPGVIHSKLNTVTSKSMQVTATNKIMPPSHKTNSICPGRSSHHLTRSIGLRETAICGFLRLLRLEISRACGD